MYEQENPFAPPVTSAESYTVGVDYLLLDGNVNVGKNKGIGQILITRHSLFAFRVNNQNQQTGFLIAGVIGAMIGHWIDKARAKNRPTPHLQDSEIMRLKESVRKKLERHTLLAKLPLNTALHVERKFSKMLFTAGDESPVIYGSMFNKKKIVRFLATLGIDTY